MIYRQFGNTGILMPALSAGMMRCMYQWQDHPMTMVPSECQENVENIVDRALDLGINHFETARGYGSSERQLGHALARYPRRKFYVQTKIRAYRDPDVFVAAFHESLLRLNLQHVDLLTIHGINDHRSFWYACRENGCLGAARRLQDQGKVGHVGFSTHGPPDVIREAVSHRQDGGFEYVNLHWYYIFQENWPVIELAHDNAMGVQIISPSDKGGRLHTPSAKICELSNPLTPMQFNDLFCLSRPQVSTIGIGAARPDDFDEHLHALDYLQDGRSSKMLTEIDRQWRRAMRLATGFERPEGWWRQLPGWERTPGYVNIPFILWLFNLAKGWDLIDYARMRYKSLGTDFEWVPGNKAANIESLKFPDNIAGEGVDREKIVQLLGEAHLLLG